MAETVGIGTTSRCRRCDEPIEYIDCWESPLWVHRGRYGEWPGWCDPKLCHAEPQNGVSPLDLEAQAIELSRITNEQNRTAAIIRALRSASHRQETEGQPLFCAVCSQVTYDHQPYVICGECARGREGS